MKYTMNPVALVVFVALIALALTDLGFVIFGGTGSSISAWWVGVFNVKAPFANFVFGVVIGHLAFYMTPVVQKKY